ncbi:MAG: hypothetical protein DRO46_04495 [Candidatus Hecatellales archaeon]|nr:MAG: hypothetical protein DRO46_04495 [Candidatus Hecatellales archaeon]
MAGWGALVLAGGAGSRLGMVNKAFLNFAGEPLLVKVVNQALKVADRVVVSISKQAQPERYLEVLPGKVELVKDEREGLGPLEGLRQGMRKLDSQGVSFSLALACDLPFLNPQVLRFLLEEAERLKAEALIPRWPNGFKETLHSVYQPHVFWRAAEEALTAGERLILDAVKRLNRIFFLPVEKLKPLDPELSTFTNITTFTDLEEALRKLREA